MTAYWSVAAVLGSPIFPLQPFGGGREPLFSVYSVLGLLFFSTWTSCVANAFAKLAIPVSYWPVATS